MNIKILTNYSLMNKKMIKKLFAIAFVGVFALSACAQKNAKNAERKEISYTVNGVCPADVKKVYLMDPTLNQRVPVVDSIDVVGGKFTYTGKAMEESFLGIAGPESNPVMFIVDDKPVNIDLAAGTLKGSPLNEKYNAYQVEFNKFEKQQEEICAPFFQAQKEGKSAEEMQAIRASVMEKLEPVSEELTKFAKQVIKDNPDNVIPAAFIGNVMYDYELPELQELISDKYAYANHPLVDRVKQYVEAESKKQAIVGQQFINIEEPDVDGNPHKLSEYVGKGNYVLIDFWASWCGPCMQEMPNVKANYEKYKSKGFNVVGLSFDRSKDAWVKAIKEKELDWVHLSDLKFWQTIAASTYGINAIPSSLLVDPTGKVIARDLRGPALGKKLAEIYGE